MILVHGSGGKKAEEATLPTTAKSSTNKRQMDKRPSFKIRQALENASLILDWCYIGGGQVAASRGALREMKVGWVLNCCERIPFASEKTRNLLLRMSDTRSENFSPFLPEAFEFLDRAKCSGSRVLVHCMVGASRSATIVLAYLVGREGMSLLEAWRLVRGKRKVARPNRGFSAQLIEYEQEIHGEASMGIQEFGYE